MTGSPRANENDNRPRLVTRCEYTRNSQSEEFWSNDKIKSCKSNKVDICRQLKIKLINLTHHRT